MGLGAVILGLVGNLGLGVVILGFGAGIWGLVGTLRLGEVIWGFSNFLIRFKVSN